MPVPTPFLIDNVLMTGAWVKWNIPNVVNAVMLQNRSDIVSSVSMNADGSNRFTIRSKNALVLGSFNTNNQTLYLKATAGSVIEIMTVNLP